MIEVRPVGGRRDFGRFIDYPYARNAADPHWVPPLRLSERARLNPAKNPFFQHADVDLLLAWRGDRVAGRIAAIDDRLHERTHHDNTAMFGFFEAADEEAARALLAAVEEWARARGRASVRGPINPSLHESAGILIDGFDTDPMVMMPHNPREYPAFIEGAGYRKIKDLFAWLYDLDDPTPPLAERIAERIRERTKLTLRPLKLAEFTREVECLRLIYCDAWANNWGFVPPTEPEFRRIATELKPIFDERAAMCAEVDGHFVGCVVAVPDINQVLRGTGGRLFPRGLVRLLMRRRHIDQARVLLLGIRADFRASGLYPLLMVELRKQAAGGPYRRAEFSWILEDNQDINRPAEWAGARRYKTYRIYIKNL